MCILFYIQKVRLFWWHTVYFPDDQIFSIKKRGQNRTATQSRRQLARALYSTDDSEQRTLVPLRFLGGIGSAWVQVGPSQYRVPCFYSMVTSMLQGTRDDKNL